MLAQEPFDRMFRRYLGDVEIRDTTDWTAPSGAEYTVIPTADGRWSGARWYSEVGGTHPIETVDTDSSAAALDWVWWLCAADYLEAWVRPAGEQKDRKTRETARSILSIGFRGSRDRTEALSQEQWSDTASNPIALGFAALRFAGTGSDTAIRLARNPGTPPSALAVLASRGTDPIRWQVAGNPSANARTIARLRGADDFAARWYLATRPETPTPEIVAWSVTDSALWTAVLDRPDATAAQLTALDVASSGSQRVRIARHPGADGVLLQQLADECDAAVGVSLLASGRLSPAALDTVLTRASDWDGWRAHAALDRLRAPIEQTIRLPLDLRSVEGLSRSPHAPHRLIAAAASGTDSDSVALLATDASVDVRALLTGRPDLAASVQAVLAQDSEVRVRKLLTQNRTITAATATTLTSDTDRMVRISAIGNPALPSEVLDTLLDGPEAETARNYKRIREELRTGSRPGR